ncbi:hypothetical protein ONZ45_g5548 [Pleurotus djamor]|nr:hypothetical protein ONZ45_g5548 [Pleurotus djamor]
MAVAILGFFILPDFPNQRPAWLDPNLYAIALQRLEEDVDPTYEVSSRKRLSASLTNALTNWKIWWLTGILTSAQLSYSFAAFFPTLAQTLGYNNTITLLLCAPPWILATAVAFVITWHSDQVLERCWHSIVPAGLAALGFVISMSSMNIVARFLMAVAPISGMCIVAWAVSTIKSEQRAIGIAIVNGVSQLGLVAGPYAWDRKWGPSYTRSLGTCLASICVSMAMSLVLRYRLASLNQKDQRDADNKVEKAVHSTSKYIL